MIRLPALFSADCAFVVVQIKLRAKKATDHRQRACLRPLGHPPRIRRLLPSNADEFAAVCEAYHDHEETLLHDQWERMRLLATITIQPHVKGKVTPERLLPFPWDSSGLGHGNHRAETKKTSPRPVSKEEDRKRFEALMKRIG